MSCGQGVGYPPRSHHPAPAVCQKTAAKLASPTFNKSILRDTDGDDRQNVGKQRTTSGADWLLEVEMQRRLGSKPLRRRADDPFVARKRTAGIEEPHSDDERSRGWFKWTL